MPFSVTIHWFLPPFSLFLALDTYFISFHLLNLYIGDGLSQAYTKLVMCGMKLGNIDIIQNYQFLRHINFSNNMIRDITALGNQNLHQLLTVDLSKNRITDPSIAFHPSLQVLNLSENQIENIPESAFPHPFLTSLNLNGNRIEEIHGIDKTEMPLRFFEARANKLKTCANLNQHTEELDLV